MQRQIKGRNVDVWKGGERKRPGGVHGWVRTAPEVEEVCARYVPVVPPQRWQRSVYSWVQQNNEAVRLLNVSSASRRKHNTRDEFGWFLAQRSCSLEKLAIAFAGVE